MLNMIINQLPNQKKIILERAFKGMVSINLFLSLEGKTSLNIFFMKKKDNVYLISRIFFLEVGLLVPTMFQMKTNFYKLQSKKPFRLKGQPSLLGRENPIIRICHYIRITCNFKHHIDNNHKPKKT